MPQDNTEESEGIQEIPVDPSELNQQVPLWAAMATAGKEERKWENWEYLSDIKRDNDRKWLRLYGLIVMLVTMAFTYLFLAALGIWAWHQLAPECWRWLDEVRLNKIQSTLFSGGMGAVIAGVLRNQLSKV
ncbi:hypothetical protein EII18_08440 [Comamonadaceae bacterium OH3737_COT-264]|nr:hypothetical protein EII18_08440 [Comamonadaceae bacterium OH3737_COT-264]